MSVLSDYLNEIDAARTWSPFADPFADPLALTLGGQGTGAAWFGDASAPLLSALPGDARQLAHGLFESWGAVAGNVSQFVDDAAAVASAVGSIVGMVAPYVEGMFAMADASIAIVEAQQSTNDTRRRDARLSLVHAITEAGPGRWGPTQMNRYQARYNRKRTLKSDTQPMVWPPSRQGGPLSPSPIFNPPSNPSGPCGQGAGELSGGLDGSCDGWIVIDPIFGVNAINETFGGYTRIFRGMERSHDGGVAVVAALLGMQSGALTNPALNLQVNGEALRAWWDAWQTRFWGRYFSPPLGVALPSAYMEDSRKGLRAFTGPEKGAAPAEVRAGWQENTAGAFGDRVFYRTPGGLIGTYTSQGGGTVTAPVLEEWGVWAHASGHTYDQGGGNFYSAADFNRLASTVNAFFALRAATLRRQEMMRAIVDDVPAFLGMRVTPGGGFAEIVPEERVRTAIAQAANVDLSPEPSEPSGPATVVGGAGGLLGGFAPTEPTAGPSGPGGLNKAPEPPGAGGGGLAIAAGSLLAIGAGAYAWSRRNGR